MRDGARPRLELVDDALQPSHACVSDDADAFVVGTQRVGGGREEWLASFREQVASGMGVRLEGTAVQGFADGSLGWAFDRASFVVPDIVSLPTRLTAVLREEGGTWKLVHAHFSLAVPDEVAMQSATGWAEQLGEISA
ncbi:MAG TPA: nuclear transport factor 2 family protein [Solirubrobacteraceae bacterium]